MRLLAIALLATAAACASFGTSSSETGTPPAGDAATDAGTSDAAGHRDVGSPDAGEPDAGEPDADAEPILGTTTVQNEYWYNAPPGVPASAFQYAANYTGSVTRISFFLDGRTTAGCTVQAGLYSEKNGGPGDLLTSGTVTSAVTGAWNTVMVPQVLVSGGQKYWLAFLNPGGVATLSFRIAGKGGVAVDGAPDLAALPTPWTTHLTFTGSPASAFALP